MWKQNVYKASNVKSALHVREEKQTWPFTLYTFVCFALHFTPPPFQSDFLPISPKAYEAALAFSTLHFAQKWTQQKSYSIWHTDRAARQKIADFMTIDSIFSRIMFFIAIFNFTVNVFIIIFNINKFGNIIATETSEKIVSAYLKFNNWRSD